MPNNVSQILYVLPKKTSQRFVQVVSLVFMNPSSFILGFGFKQNQVSKYKLVKIAMFPVKAIIVMILKQKKPNSLKMGSGSVEGFF